MNNRILGILAFIGAPFLCIDQMVHGQNGPQSGFEHTSVSGLFNLIYMLGWMCSIAVLRRIKATGTAGFGKAILVIQLCTLTLANVWNVYEIIAPGSESTLYFILDLFWPISNLVLLIIGITVIRARRLQGWKRFVPLLAGIWFPVSIVLFFTAGQGYLTMVLSGLYSAVMWTLLAYVSYTSEEEGAVVHNLAGQ
ncbi:MAG TPA: hypothetical protein VD996_00020 [Chitinophagaceae bacterium]|nr:hypothetical protein [Chitinophagaceae bacterium]